MGYDGIRGFSSRLKNRVSETSTPKGGQSPRGRPKTPPQPQRQFKQLKVYDETPSGRPLPTLQQIRQANLRRIFEEEGVDAPCDICGDPTHDHRNCTKEAYCELDRALLWGEIQGVDVQIVTSLIQAYVLLHGATGEVT